MSKINPNMKESFSILNDRILWYDGSISLEPEKIIEFILTGKCIDKRIFATSITNEIKQFNRLNKFNQITTKEYLESLNIGWDIPEEYLNLNINKFIVDKLSEEIKINKFSENEIEERIARVELELALYVKYDIIEILKTLIYIVDTFNNNKVVWGTGRGSSCSSYILYLIGLHDVDSVKYELEVTEFFRKG